MIRTALPSGYLSIKSSRVMILPPDSIIFLAAISEIEKAQTISLWPIAPAPRSLLGTTTTSPFLVTLANLLTLTSLLFDRERDDLYSKDLQIGALVFLKAPRRAHILLSTKLSANINIFS